MAVQIATPRPSQAEELRNKLRDLGEPTVEMAAPKTSGPTPAEQSRALSDAIRQATAHLATKDELAELKAQVPQLVVKAVQDLQVAIDDDRAVPKPPATPATLESGKKYK